jgi:hypothetical protein
VTLFLKYHAEWHYAEHRYAESECRGVTPSPKMNGLNTATGIGRKKREKHTTTFMLINIYDNKYSI